MDSQPESVASLACTPRDRATVVVVHGVGLGPEFYANLVRRLEEAGAFERVITVSRPGYRTDDDGAAVISQQTLGFQVDALLDIIDEAHGTGPVVWLGVSGGATLGLAAAAAHPDRFAGLVLHEPLVGPLAPTLHDGVQAASARLAADPDGGAIEFVRGLIGERTWNEIASRAVPAVSARAELIGVEVAAFAAFAPAAEQLDALERIPMLTTIGRESGRPRDEAARVLVEHCGAEVAVIPGGHFAPHDAPAELAAATRQLAVER